MRTAAASFVVLMFACQSAAPPPAALTQDQRYEAIARDVLTNFTAGRYEAAAKDFDATMMAGLPPVKLGDFARQLTAQAGAFKSVGAAQFSTEQGYRVVVLPALYERAALNVRVVFDNEGKVAGLFFQPSV